MELRPAALRFVLEQGLPAVIEVGGGSMEPTIRRRAKVNVVALTPDAPLAPGDVVLIATPRDVLLLHRVLHVFEDSGQEFVVHQGDVPGSTFGVAARRDVLARMTAFADGTGAPAPTPERLDAVGSGAISLATACCRPRARRGPPPARGLGVGDVPAVRACARAFRRLARLVDR